MGQLVWDIESGECWKTLSGHRFAVYSYAVEEKGQLISGSFDREIKVWDIEAGKCLKTLYGHSSVFSLAISKEGLLISV